MFMIKKQNCIALTAIVVLCLTLQPNAFGFPPVANLDSPFDLKVGETADINSDFQITLLNVLDDSRCPSDVTCIWEGTVSAEVNIVKDGENRGKYVIPFGLIDSAASQSIDGFFIMLYDVKPYPISTNQITPSEYVATLIVSKIKKTLDSPLKQFKSGVSINDTQCKDNLFLVIKSSNSSPACVKSETVNKLLLRGWALNASTIDSFEECESAGNAVMESYPRQCKTPDGKHFVEEIN